MEKKQKVSHFVVFFVESPAAELPEDLVRWYWKGIVNGKVCPACAALGSKPTGETMCAEHLAAHRRLLKAQRNSIIERGRRLKADRRAADQEEAEEMRDAEARKGARTLA